MRTRAKLQARLCKKASAVVGHAFKDRSSGGFDMSGMAEDMKEPGRTERILGKPFFGLLFFGKWKHTTFVDAFHARAGVAFFRVNGSSRVGVGWRLGLIGATMTIGLLAGLKPAIEAGSAGGVIQALLVWSLQITLGLLCFFFSPDADRVFSALAGTQFLTEGLSNCLLWIASFLDADGKESLQGGAFNLALLAVFVPIIQLIEQRAVTPTLKIIYTEGCNPRALAGALLVLLTALPGAIKKAVAMITGGGGGGGGGGVDMGSIGKGMAGLVGRSAASGDVGGKSQKIKMPSMKKMPSMGGSKKTVTRAPSTTKV